MSVLVVDAGRTNCRAAWFSAPDDPLPGPVAVVPSQATLVDPAGPHQVAATVTAAVGALECSSDIPIALVVAVAGGLSRPDAAATLADQLAAAVAIGGGLPAAVTQVIVTSDVVAAHAGAFDGAPGVVLAIGTGAVALALSASGHALVDGAGYLLGDAGSGFAIGRAGLAAAVRHGDGRRGGSAALAQAAIARFAPAGGRLREVTAVLHGDADPVRRVALIAGFAPDVADAARAGDPVATAIWQAAVNDLADTASAACAALPEPGGGEVALVGALCEVEDLLVAPLRTRLAERVGGLTVRTGSGDALVGAARLARRPAGGYETLLLVRPVYGPVNPGRAPASGLRTWPRAAAGSCANARRDDA